MPSAFDELLDLVFPPPPPQRCCAHTRSGGECRQWAVEGKTRCRMHGGAPGSGRPQVTGKYSRRAIQSQKLVGALLRLGRAARPLPEPIDAPPGTFDPEQLDEQGRLAHQQALHHLAEAVRAGLTPGAAAASSSAKPPGATGEPKP